MTALKIPHVEKYVSINILLPCLFSRYLASAAGGKHFFSLCSTAEPRYLGNKPINIAPKQPLARDCDNILAPWNSNKEKYFSQIIDTKLVC